MKKLGQYLALGAAALLPLQASAQGTIVYVNPPNVIVGLLQGAIAFDLNSDGTSDIEFRKFSSEFEAIPLGKNEVSAVANQPPEAGGMCIPIPFGVMVSSGTSWQGRYSAPSVSDHGPLLASNRGAFVAYGPFAGLDSYLGIRFYIGSDLHYGWIRLDLDNGYPNQALGYLTEWAYNSVPNAPLAAGVVPEPSTWALFALGAAAILRFRRS